VIEALALSAALHSTPAAVKPCKDPIVQVIKDAGWRGKQIRVAYAVAWRESNHTPGESTYPDLGLFQINQPAWGGSRYWPSQPLNALSNAKAAHRIWKSYSWTPWGLNADGSGVDTADYSWSDWQVANWIWNPYVEGLRRFDRLPKACR